MAGGPGVQDGDDDDDGDADYVKGDDNDADKRGGIFVKNSLMG